MARKTLEQFVQRATRLYEQEPTRLGQYVGRWLRWVSGGVGVESGLRCGRAWLVNESIVVGNVLAG